LLLQVILIKYKKRVDSVYFETEMKRTERKKQFVMSQSNESEKARSFIGVRRNFSRRETSTFCISFSKCWQSVFPIR